MPLSAALFIFLPHVWLMVIPLAVMLGFLVTWFHLRANYSTCVLACTGFTYCWNSYCKENPLENNASFMRLGHSLLFTLSLGTVVHLHIGQA